MKFSDSLNLTPELGRPVVYVLMSYIIPKMHLLMLNELCSSTHTFHTSVTDAGFFTVLNGTSESSIVARQLLSVVTEMFSSLSRGTSTVTDLTTFPSQRNSNIFLCKNKNKRAIMVLYHSPLHDWF